MNRIYKVVFNRVLGVYTAVSELVASDGKKSPAASLGKAVPAALCALALSGLAVSPAVSNTITQSVTFDDSTRVTPTYAGDPAILNTDPATPVEVTVNGGGVLDLSPVSNNGKAVDVSNGAEVDIHAKEFWITSDTVNLSGHNGSDINAVLGGDGSVIHFYSKNTTTATSFPGSYAIGAMNDNGVTAENNINLQADVITVDSASKGIQVSGANSSVNIVATGVTSHEYTYYSVDLRSGDVAYTYPYGTVSWNEDVISVNGGYFTDSSSDKKNVSVTGTVLYLEEGGGNGIHVKDGGSVELIAKQMEGVAESPLIYIGHSGYTGGLAGIYTENSADSGLVNDVRVTSEGGLIFVAITESNRKATTGPRRV